MGVPALFRWLSQKYPKIISSVVEDHPREIDGQSVPVDATTPNPNGEEFDNLYLDMNGIVHPCSHPEDKPAPANEEEMMIEVFKYTDRVVKMARPRKVLMIAVDGVAPRAKMNQQRSRRFRSAQEAREKDAEKEEFVRLLKQQKGGVLDDEVLASISKKTWDTNSITPGTPFMEILSASLKYWVAYKLNTDPSWEKLKIIISDASVPGEGEHKIMEFVRSQRRQPTHDPNTRHIIYGLDADLIMLGLATHEPYFRVLREDVFFQEGKQKVCNMCGQTGHVAEACKGEAKKKEGEFDEKQGGAIKKPFCWLHVGVLREYLAAELDVPGQGFKFDLERAIDDWVFMCFFVGNDFLPHLPSLDIRDNGIDILIALWRDNLPLMGGYVTKDGHVDKARAQFILEGLAKQEDSIFKRRKQVEERREQNAKRRKLENEARTASQGGEPGASIQPTHQPRNRKSIGVPKVEDLMALLPKEGETRETRAKEDEMFMNRKAIYQANMANKSAAAALKNQLAGKENPGDSADPQNGNNEQDNAKEDETVNDTANNGDSKVTDSIGTPAKRKADHLENGSSTSGGGKVDPDAPPPDNVRLWEEGYSDRYYETKFHADPKDIDFRHKVANAYVEGLSWVLLYYFQGCPSWTWFYPYHYAPFAADFADIGKLDIKFEKGRTFRPYEQLMGVMPAASSHTLPEVFRGLMSDEDSEIIDFYPEEFPIDLNGKKWAWQGVALLPFIDEKRLLDAMAKKYPLLTSEENARNAIGDDMLLFSTKHTLYEDVVESFYSKKAQANPLAELSVNPTSSEGLHGVFKKNESYIPSSALTFPFPSKAWPDLDDDQSITVIYKMPESAGDHKSTILRGVQFPRPTLDVTDIQETKARAGRSGRSFGGAQFRGNDRNYRGNRNGDHRSGRGRGYGGNQYQRDNGPAHRQGGQLNMDNPFAAHLSQSPAYNHGYPQPGGAAPPPPHIAAAQGWLPQPLPGNFQGSGRGRGGFGGPPPPPPQFLGGRGGYNGQRNYNEPRDDYRRDAYHPTANRVEGGYQGGHRGGHQGGYQGVYQGGDYQDRGQPNGSYDRNNNRYPPTYDRPRYNDRGSDYGGHRGGRGGYNRRASGEGGGQWHR